MLVPSVRRFTCIFNGKVGFLDSDSGLGWEVSLGLGYKTSMCTCNAFLTRFHG